ncbi:FAD-binding protein [Williamsia sp. CHRR-6]|uniref:FAD-binding protein n=1 Tax=Williamsia sp. CHRR-6 TaxID=2835871 RepID=UPI0027DD54C0|nr:FAD-binding protein [Williamsia sp. CHRR-6]
MTHTDSPTTVLGVPGRRLRNWGRTQTISPTRAVTPRDTDEVAAVVRAALARNTTVKAIGAGHSFSAIAATDAMLIDTRHLRGLIATDVPRGQVTLGAGTHLYEVPGLIDPLGLAMPNLGDIDRQTLAGAVSTSTHGTGVGFGGLATQVIGATMVTGTGDTLRIGRHDGRLLAAIAPGLGALGVLVDITLQCVPAFDLSAVEEITDFDSAVADFGTRIREVDHHEFY